VCAFLCDALILFCVVILLHLCMYDTHRIGHSYFALRVDIHIKSFSLG